MVVNLLLWTCLTLAWWPGSMRRSRELAAALLAVSAALLLPLADVARLPAVDAATATLSLLILGTGLLCNLQRSRLPAAAAGFASVLLGLLALLLGLFGVASTLQLPDRVAATVHLLSGCVWLAGLRQDMAPRRLLRAAAAAMAGTATLVVLGWVLGMTSLARSGVPAVPMRPVTALLLLTAAVALVAAGAGRRRVARWWLLPTAVLAPLLLLESAGMQLGLSGLAAGLVMLPAAGGTVMPATLVLCLLVGALGTLLIAPPGQFSLRRDALVWACGLLLMMVGMLALVGTAARLPTFQALAMPRPMALLTALALLLYGIALCAAGLASSVRRLWPVVVPLLVTFTTLAIAAMLAAAMKGRSDLQAGWPLPRLLLLFGALLSCVLGISLRQWALARDRARQLERARQDLELRIGEREHAYELLRDSDSELSDVLESISDAFYILDEQWCFVFANKQAERLLRLPRRELLGQNLWASFPELAGGQIEQAYRRAVTQQRTEQLEFYFEPWSCWLSLRAYPHPRGLAVYFRDVTASKRAELELIEANLQSERAQKMARLGHWEADANSKRLRASTEALRILGLRPEALDAGPAALLQYVHPHDRAALQRAHQALWDTVLDSDIEFRVVADGVTRFVHELGTRVHGADGTLLGITGALQDITEERQAQCKLRESEQRFRIVTEVALDAVWDWDLRTDALWWSYGMFRLFGFASEDLETDSRSWLLRVHPDDRSRVSQSIHAVIDSTDEFWSCEYRFICKDGRIAYVLDRGVVIRLDGVATRMTGAMTDLTQRRHAEQELARLNRALRMRAACSEALIRVRDEPSLLAEICQVVVDAGGYRMAWVGYARDDQGQAIEAMASAGHVDGYLDDIQLDWSPVSAVGAGPAGRAVRSGELVCCADIVAADSGFVWSSAALQRGYRSVICLPLRDDSGAFGVLTLYASEVHEVTADEQELLIALADDLAHGIQNLRAEGDQQRLRLATLKMATMSGGEGLDDLQELLAELCRVVDADAAFIGRVVAGEMAQLKCLASCGYPVEPQEPLLEIAGSACERVLDDGDAVVKQAAHRQLGKGVGSPGWAAEGFVGVRLGASTQDATGLLAVLFRAPLKSSGFQLACLHIFAVRIAAELARKDAGAMIRRHAQMLNEAHDAILTLDAQGRISYCNNSTRWLYGAGTGLIGEDVQGLFHPSDSRSYQVALTAVMEHGDWIGEVLHQRLDGQPLYLESHWTLVREEPGVHSILVISADISARKRAQEQLEQAMQALQDRNRELREFAFVASHDLQEPLRKVRSYSDRLTERYATQLDARALDYFQRMTGAVVRMQRLIDDLLMYSRVLSGRPKHAAVALDEVVRGVLSDLEVGLREANASVELPQLPVVMGDSTQLRQVFQNLIGNALKYRSKTRLLRIRLGAVQILDGVPYWEITVSDNGIGFSNDDATQIFAPFQRLHGRAEYEGSGIGLAIVRRIVESYGGLVRAQGREGEGADFTVRWPVIPHDPGLSVERVDLAPPAYLRVDSSAVVAPAAAAALLPRHVSLADLLEAVRCGATDAQRLLSERYAKPVRELLRRNGVTDEADLGNKVEAVLRLLNEHVRTAESIDSRSISHELRLLVSRFYPA